MKLRLWVVAALALAAFLACNSGVVGYGSGKEAPRVDKDTLKNWLGDPNLVLLDVRAEGDWQGSDKKIKGALRRDPKKVKEWAVTFNKDKKIVLYCA